MLQTRRKISLSIIKFLFSKARLFFPQYFRIHTSSHISHKTLSVCVHLKYIFIKFPYTGQDMNRPTYQFVRKCVVMRFTQGYFGKVVTKLLKTI